jgi:hypothetical protein
MQTPTDQSPRSPINAAPVGSNSGSSTEDSKSLFEAVNSARLGAGGSIPQPGEAEMTLPRTRKECQAEERRLLTKGGERTRAECRLLLALADTGSESDSEDLGFSLSAAAFATEDSESPRESVGFAGNEAENSSPRHEEAENEPAFDVQFPSTYQECDAEADRLLAKGGKRTLEEQRHMIALVNRSSELRASKD